MVSTRLSRAYGLRRVCIRDAKEAFSVRPRFPEHFTYLTLDVQDNEEQNLISLFPRYVRGRCLTPPSTAQADVRSRAKVFIDDALQNGGRVLVHCNGGISLSPAFVVMYVMQYYRMNWEDALHTVQNRRYCISPNGGFLTQIKVSSTLLMQSLDHLTMFPRSTNRYTRPTTLLCHIQVGAVVLYGEKGMTMMTRRRTSGGFASYCSIGFLPHFRLGRIRGNVQFDRSRAPSGFPWHLLYHRYLPPLLILTLWR